MDINAFGDWIWASMLGLATIAPLGTFVAVLVAGIAIWQKSRADRRSAWWERLRWATDTALKDDEQSRRVGTAAVLAVQRFKLVTPEDQPLLGAIGDEVLTEELSEVAEGFEVIGRLGNDHAVDRKGPIGDNVDNLGGADDARES
ncbi:hypothetical protein [Microbacterium sp. A93]|uniref:hypothetical protein n=1 Tax=Microbacterium sp. A93 TaxID=3450716 RepID=UPI003F4215FF